MRETIPDNVTTTGAKPARKLGGGVAFGSDFGGGMSIREYIATQAMAGLLACGDNSYEGLAQKSVRVADYLLAELAK